MEGPRLASGILVNALIRRVDAEGGSAMVLAKGDVTAGTIILLLADRGETFALMERSLGVDGYAWADSGPADPDERAAYLERRRKSDPDLWVVELDHPEAKRIALAIL